MHNDNIEPIYNLYDPEHPEWFIYDAELLNAWFWSEFVVELEELGEEEEEDAEEDRY